MIPRSGGPGAIGALLAALGLSAQAQLQPERLKQRGQLLDLYGLPAGLPGRNLRLVRADTTRQLLLGHALSLAGRPQEVTGK